VLALAAEADAFLVRALMVAGAAGVALKQAPCAELLHAMLTVARGGTYVDPSLVGAKGVWKTPSTELGGATTRLSEREDQVLRLVARGHSAKDIAAALRLSPRTLETYKARAMSKLSLRSRTELFRFALRSGWLSDV